MNRIVIVRGVSGSGKSYLVNKKYRDDDATILSTDDLWMDRNFCYYFWSPDGLKIAHQLNKIKCKEACKQEVPTIVIDNTNTVWWELEPYIDIAKEFNYEVEIVESNTEWSKDVNECFKRCTHGVPKEVIQNQLDRFESVQSIEKKMHEYLAQ